MDKNISLIIVTFNRPLTLQSVIDSYLEQKYIYELIVVDDGSSKSYKEFNNYVNEKCLGCGIQYIYIKNDKNSGAAFSRYVGIKHAKGEYIFWGEDDLFLANNYVELLVPYISDRTAAVGSIYYDMSQTLNQNEKIKSINFQSNFNEPFMNWDTLEGYFRIKKPEVESILFGHAIYIVKTDVAKKIDIYSKYKVNGFREETDIQLQLRKKGVDFLYVSEAECYHLKNRIGDENKGGQHKDSRIKQEIYYIVNNNIFIDRNYQVVKEYYPELSSKFKLKCNFLLKRIRFNYLILIKKIKRIK